MPGVSPATGSAYASRGRAESNQTLMVSEEFAPNRVEIVLNCADTVSAPCLDGVIVSIRERGGPLRVSWPALPLRRDDRQHRPVALLVERATEARLPALQQPMVRPGRHSTA
jgi:hypothetical protein